MISYAVMAHPSRAALALDIQETLERRVEPTPIEWDRGEGEWDTGRRALLAYDPAAEWHAVIQDDAILADRFTEGLELAVAHAEGHPLGLYVGRCRPTPRTITKAVRAAERAGTPWIQWHGPRWGVAVCLPTRYIPALVAAADHYSHPHYDARLTRFFKMNGVWCRYPVPSLVDHDPERPSLIDSKGGDRRAHLFMADADPGGFDWQAPPVVIDRRGYVSIPARA